MKSRVQSALVTGSGVFSQGLPKESTQSMVTSPAQTAWPGLKEYSSVAVQMLSVPT